MIDFSTIKVGDKVKVVGMGAPGFAELGDVLIITSVGPMRTRVLKSNPTGDEITREDEG